MMIQRTGGAAAHILGGGITLRSGGGGGVTFLLRDDFTTDDAAPIASPRTCEPGPGTLTFTNAARWSITGGNLIYTAAATSDFAKGDELARVVGRTHISKVTNTNTRVRQGWETDAVIVHTADTSNARIVDNAVSILNILSGSITNVYAIILRSTGAFYVERIVAAWSLRWVSVANSTALLKPTLETFLASAITFDYIRVSDLPVPWTTDDGIATQVLSGARSAGDTWAHEADHLSYATITTLPSAGQIELRFRIQDASNYWQATVDSTGALDLDEVVAGVVTQRGTAAAVVTAGERIGWIAGGTTISVWDSALRQINYASASNFATATSGKLETLGTGGAVTGISTYPRTLSGTAKDALDAVVNA